MYAKKTKFYSVLRAVLIAVLGLSLCAVLFLGAIVLMDPNECRILDGVTVGGVDLGGMTQAEARETLRTALNQPLLTEELAVILPEDTILLSPADAALKVDIRNAVKDAYRFGRKDDQVSKEISLMPYLSRNEEAIRGKLEAYAAKYDTSLSDSHYRLEGSPPELSTERFDDNAPCQTLVITLGVPTVKLDVDAVLEQILQFYAGAAQCAPEDYRVSIPQIAPLEEPAAPDLAAIAEELTREPVNDSLDRNTYQLVHGAYGYAFDQSSADEAVTAAEPGAEVRIPMEYVTPEILGDGVYFRDVLGYCETKHNTDENRNNNLRLLCAELDGVILNPGDEFSFNMTVGERTPERGYLPATAYSGKRIIKDYGGGVCQGSTTLYNCALLADMEILERHCHGATVSYVPLGLDASVNWNTNTDLQLRNNFHFPMMIKAEVADGYVKMKLLGTDEKDYYIEMRTGTSPGEGFTYAASYKCKYSKETGELISKDLEARSTYYPIS